MPEERFRLDTPSGEVGAVYERPRRAAASIVVAHGAGAGMDHPFMAGFCRAIAGEGIAALRFNFPYMEAGKRSTDRPAVAVAAIGAAFEAARTRAGSDRERIWVGGKSLGGRMASVAVAEGLPAAGLVFLGYPLHPPGKPERIRDEHLYGIEVPMLFLQGTRDPFATPSALQPVIRKLGKRATLKAIEGGGHSLEISRRDDPRDVATGLAAAAAAFIREHG